MLKPSASYGTIVSVARPRSPSIGSIVSVGRRKADKCEGDCEIVVRKLHEKIERLESELLVTQALLGRRESEIACLEEKLSAANQIAFMTPLASPTVTKLVPKSSLSTRSLADDAMMGN